MTTLPHRSRAVAPAPELTVHYRAADTLADMMPAPLAMGESKPARAAKAAPSSSDDSPLLAAEQILRDARLIENVVARCLELL